MCCGVGKRQVEAVGFGFRIVEPAIVQLIKVVSMAAKMTYHLAAHLGGVK